MNGWTDFSFDDFVVYGAALATFVIAVTVLLRASKADQNDFWRRWFSVLACVLGATVVQVALFEFYQDESKVSLSSFLLLQTVHRGRLLETYAILLALFAVGLVRIF